MIFMLRSEWIGSARPQLPPTTQAEDIDLRKMHNVQVIIH